MALVPLPFRPPSPLLQVHPLRVIFMISRDAAPKLLEKQPGQWSAVFHDFIAQVGVRVGLIQRVLAPTEGSCSHQSSHDRGSSLILSLDISPRLALGLALQNLFIILHHSYHSYHSAPCHSFSHSA